MVHEFLLFADDEGITVEDVFSDFYNQKNSGLIQKVVKLEDEFVCYIWDTLKFFKSKYPNEEIHDGLAYDGYSLIIEPLKAKQVFEGWYNLLKLGPSSILLTGEYTWCNGLDESGEYDMFELEKDEILDRLNELISMFEQSATGNYSVLHSGL